MATQHYDPSRPPSGMMSPLRVRSRTQSISSDKPSTVGHGLVSPPVSVSPQAAFIATSAASQIVTNDHDTHADTWYDESGMIPAGDTALVSYPALQLVNNFLDQLLFNFLQVSKATTLAALRPAVSEVLKPKLAKDAVNNADEELHEYLGGADEDDYVQPHGADPSRDWDLELVWKRTRLRCMVYSSLGDMEEEDEDLYMEQENLEIGADEQISDVISPAVAIFLTSVLEYMGELTLTVAGQAAYHRVRANFEREIKDGTRTMTDIADRIVVEEGDMERVALDRTLGRLWRGWKKRIRAPATVELGSRSFSRASLHHRQDSTATEAYVSQHQSPAAIEESAPDYEAVEREETSGPREKDRGPAEIPLPISLDDVDEIEIPGLAYNSDDEDEALGEADAQPQRPKSLVISPLLRPVVTRAESGPSRRLKHERSISLPVTPSSRFVSPLSELDDGLSIAGASMVSAEDPVASPPPQQGPGYTATEAASTNARPRSTMMIANTAFGPLMRSPESKSIAKDEVDAPTTYEKAEIMTSARVSVASSSPPSSEGGVKRSASVRSARIVDVPGPRSPRGSRSPSMDATERMPSASVARGNGTSTPPIAEEPVKSKPSTTRSRESVSSLSATETSADRVRTSVQPSARVTDPREIPYDQAAYVEATAPRYPHSPSASVPVASLDNSTRTNGRHGAYSQPARGPSTARQHSHYSNGFIDEPIPEIPSRAPGHSTRHAPRSNSFGKASLERTRTRESEDGAPPLPIQSNSASRPTHTSGSSSSSATGRLKAVRTSEEHVASHAESVARNFEELIHSNQTITYTLTPENMRDMDSPRSIDSPKMSRFSRGKPEETLAQDRSRSSSSATDLRSVQSSQRTMGANTNMPQDRNGQRPAPITVPATSPISISKSPGLKSAGAAVSPVMGPKSPKVPASLARDARVPPDSTADFAEFIKSTGPPTESRPPPVRNTQAAAAPSAHKMSSDSRRTSSTSNQNRYQPRDAAADAASENRDLVDFIRQGPPSNNPRVHRLVNSSRSAADTDYGYPVATVASKAVDVSIPEVRHSQASTNVTEYSGPSMQSSINSNTALLKNKGPSLPKMMDDDDMMPKRKTRRVRDPYAIDFSDEEDEELIAATPKPPPKKEESLAEFLQNYQPPPEPLAPPVSQRIPKKKSSAPSLINRLRNRDFHREPKTSGQALESRSLNSRTGTAGTSGSKGHIPIQVNMPSGYNAYGPVDSYSRQSSTVSTQPASGPSAPRRMPMKKFEPRDPTPSLGRSGTAELAAFLRDSEPPPSMSAPAVQSPTADESSSFSRFVRRKKPVV